MGRIWIINCLILTILSGGVIALALMIYNKNFIERIKYFFYYFKSMFLSQKITGYQDSVKSGGKAVFPFAVAIVTGSALSFFIKIV